jgi:RNA polymerase sigma-70 factor (ECF subfamily)
MVKTGMDETRRRLVLEAIASGRVPALLPRKTWGGMGSGLPCSACRKPIHAEQLETEFDDQGQSYRLHIECQAVWETVMATGALPPACHGGDPLVPEAEWTDLIRAISQGDETALRELYDRSHRIVFTLSLRILNDALTAEEVTLDVYQAVWERAATYDASRGSVVGWIMNQARSRALDRRRRQRRKKRVDAGKADLGEIVNHVEAPTEERASELDRALEALTLDERRAIETAYFEELTYAEVAERLGAPLGTIKTRIRSGLAKLRTLLQHKEDL